MYEQNNLKRKLTYIYLFKTVDMYASNLICILVMSTFCICSNDYGISINLLLFFLNM